MTIKEEKVLKNYIKGLIRESLFGGKNSKNTMKSDAIRSWSPEKEEPGRSIDDMLKSGEIRTWHREDEPERSIDDMIDAGIIHTWDKHKDGGMPEDDPQTELGDYGNPAGIDELRKLCEGYAREALFGDDDEEEDINFDDDEEYDEEYYEPFHTQDYGIYELRKLCEGMARQSVAQMLTEKKGGKGWKNKNKGKKRKNKKEKTSSKDRTIVSKLNADGTNAAHYFYKLYGVENGTEAEKASARSKGYKKAKGKKNDTGVPYKFTSRERNRLNSLLTDK